MPCSARSDSESSICEMTDKQVRWGAAFLLATVVTLAAAVPLGVLAWQGRNEVAVASDGLLIEVAGATAELNGFVLERGNTAELSLNDPQIVAAAWSLYTAEGALAYNGESVGTPPLSISLPVDALSSLTPGLYDLLVSATNRDGEPTERAARFSIGMS